MKSNFRREDSVRKATDERGTIDWGVGYAVFLPFSYQIWPQTGEYMQDLTAGLAGNGYRWEIGAVKANAGLVTITHLIGLPNENAAWRQTHPLAADFAPSW